MQTIYTDKERNLSLECSLHYTPEFMKIVHDTLWGTSGTLYQMHDLTKEMDLFKETHYLILRAGAEPVAVCLLNKKPVTLGGSVVEAFYLCLLSVRPEYGGRGFGTLLVRKATEYFLGELGEKGLIYAYVEDDNHQSRKVFDKAGYQYIGSFVVPVYSSLFPKVSSQVESLSEVDLSVIRESLQRTYWDFELLDLDYSLRADEYYVLKENNHIRCGIQVKEFKWSIRELPGVDGWLFVNILPRIPGLKRLFDPQDYRFLKIGNIFMETGYEDRLPVLIRSLLAERGLTMGMAYLNDRSEINGTIIRLMKQGLMSSVNSRAEIRAVRKGLGEEESARFGVSPLHVSLFDSV